MKLLNKIIIIIILAKQTAIIPLYSALVKVLEWLIYFSESSESGCLDR